MPTFPSDPFQILCAEHALLRRDIARIVEESKDHAAGVVANRLLVSLCPLVGQHLLREERVLYPVCERLFGGRDGPALVLREDHREIRRRLDLLADEAGRVGQVSHARLDVLHLQIADHFRKEERVLFPLTRARLSGTESSSLARRLRGLPDP